MFYSPKQNANQGTELITGAEGKIIRTKCFVLDFNGERMQSDVTAERALSHGEKKTDNHKQGSVAYPSKSSSAAAL